MKKSIIFKNPVQFTLTGTKEAFLGFLSYIDMVILLIPLATYNIFSTEFAVCQYFLPSVPILFHLINFIQWCI
ncbi:MAG: hypothetical protein ACXAAI_15680 [Promethearchaeota archaeon]